MEELDVAMTAPGHYLATSDEIQVYGNIIAKPIVGDFTLPPGEGICVKPNEGIAFEMEQYAKDVSESVLAYLCRHGVQYADQMAMVITDVVIYYSCLWLEQPEGERDYGSVDIFHQDDGSVIAVADLGRHYDNQHRILLLDTTATNSSIVVH